MNREKELMKKVVSTKLGDSILPSFSAFSRILFASILGILLALLSSEILPKGVVVSISIISVMIGVFWGISYDEKSTK